MANNKKAGGLDVLAGLNLETNNTTQQTETPQTPAAPVSEEGKKTSPPPPKFNNERAALKPIQKKGNPSAEDFEDDMEDELENRIADFQFEGHVGIASGYTKKGVLRIATMDGTVRVAFPDNMLPNQVISEFSPVSFDLTFRDPKKRGLEPRDLKAVNVKELAKASEEYKKLAPVAETISKSWIKGENCSPIIRFSMEAYTAMLLRTMVQHPELFTDSEPDTIDNALLEANGYAFLGYDARNEQLLFEKIEE